MRERYSTPPTAQKLEESTARLTASLDRLEGKPSTRRVVYVCHPLNAPTREGIEQNRNRAARWSAFLALHFHVAPECSWIVLTGELEETPDNRRRGLEIDLALVERCDEVVLVGPRISEGMAIERAHAKKHGKPVANLTGLAMEPETIALAWLPSREVNP